MQTRKIRRLWGLLLALIVLTVSVFCISAAAATEPAETETATDATATDINMVFTMGEGDDAVEYDLSDSESAQAYIDGYADNLNSDEHFDARLENALNTVRQDTPTYATAWALLPPLLAIVLALITKEVYSSLFIGIWQAACCMPTSTLKPP